MMLTTTTIKPTMAVPSTRHSTQPVKGTLRMGFTVTKSPPALVSPSQPTPSSRNLPLSSIDRKAAVRVLVDLLLLYERGDQPAKLLKGALSKALVVYYPVAGRIVESSKPGELDVACTGDGVWFVEASADCTLEQVRHLELPRLLPKDDLLPLPPPQVDLDSLILLLQVTQFACGGFVVGVRFSHAVFDGLGAAQFLKAVAEIARGLPAPTVEPIWSREFIPSPANLPSPPPSPPQGLPPSCTAFPFVTCALDVPADSINRIKNRCMQETGRKCSNFDVVTAMLWQCRTRAATLEPAHHIRLGFATNIRHLLHQVLPQEGGYYGNWVFPVGVAATSGRIVNASLVEVVSMIRDAKERLAAKFLEWVMGEEEADPYRVPVEYGTCVVADWSRIGFSEVDYGWGDPVGVAPLNDDTDFIATCIFLRPPAPMQGVRLWTRCVVKEHLAAFADQVMEFCQSS
ncbi:myricetin 3-O-glucosyl 1,2-rhamnoside 6'-O-caffeoyltransferase AT1-like [Musa acuminata AAA Group]|uniref:myricetin 3-O-glucosyl 1,2-rhamnoside 6'-O-caffeoyltransferase AT1-like n=1 Tax=Musa acuminata AAA Group TaxID=214697 RepID=UPI0031DFB29E